MGFFKYAALALLAFQVGLAVNSPEFKEAVRLMQDPKSDSRIIKSALKVLVSQNPTITTEKEQTTGNTLFHYARYFDSKQLDNNLRKMGFNPNERNALGQLPEEFFSKQQAMQRKKEKLNKYGKEYRSSKKSGKPTEKKKKRLEKDSDEDLDDFDRIALIKGSVEHLKYAYEVFDLNPEALWEDVEAQFKKLSEIVNPDSDANAHRKEQAYKNMAKLQTAYELLKRHYDSLARQKKKEERRSQENEEQSEGKGFDEQIDDFDRISSLYQPDSTRVKANYELLGLTREALWDEVYQAWKRLSDVVDPNSLANKDRRDQALANKEKLDAAYKVLKSHFEKKKMSNVDRICSYGLPARPEDAYRIFGFKRSVSWSDVQRVRQRLSAAVNPDLFDTKDQKDKAIQAQAIVEKAYLLLQKKYDAEKAEAKSEYERYKRKKKEEPESAKKQKQEQLDVMEELPQDDFFQEFNVYGQQPYEQEYLPFVPAPYEQEYVSLFGDDETEPAERLEKQKDEEDKIIPESLGFDFGDISDSEEFWNV